MAKLNPDRPRRTAAKARITRGKKKNYTPNPTGIRHHKPPMNWGAPPAFATPELMQEKIDEYFDSIRYLAATEREVPVIGKNGKTRKRKIVLERHAWIKPPTVSGLCLLLGIDRATLLSYQNKTEAFYNIVKKAKTIIQEYAEEQTYQPGASVGGMFNLKCNFNWRDDGLQAGGYEQLDVNEKMKALSTAFALGTEGDK